MMGGNTMSNTQENTLATELFLQDNYLFRRNVLSGKVEFAALPAEEPVYRTLTQAALNSIVIRAKREAVMEKGSPKAEIMELINSEEVPVFDPVKDFLGHLPPLCSGPLASDGYHPRKRVRTHADRCPGLR